MISVEAIRFSRSRKSRCPLRLSADNAATPPRFPVTLDRGV